MKTLKLFSSLVTLSAVVAVLLAGAPSTTFAAKSDPNPFAGEYCNGDVGGTYVLDLSISSSGRVTGFMGNASLIGPVSGRISADGGLSLTWKWERTALGWSEVNTPLPYKTLKIVGIVERDAAGNIVAALKFQTGEEYLLTANPCPSA